MGGFSIPTSRGFRKDVIVIAIAIVLTGWVVVLPRAAARDAFVTYNAATHTYTISPTGIDDTANLQAAFDACAANGPACTIQLTAGTFHTGQIVAHEFHGHFQGTGQQWTTVEALAKLPVGVFVFQMPTAANPWPVLFTFFNGTYSISGMTFLEPWKKPTVGWQACPSCPKKTYALFAIVSVTGLYANATVDHVTITGAAGDWTSGGPFLFNVINGIFPQALLLQPGSTDFSGVIPFQVKFQATNSAFYTVDNPLPGEDLVNSSFIIRGNTFDTAEYPVALISMSNSTSLISQNTARNVSYIAGVYAVQYSIATRMPCQQPSRYVITDNDFQVTGLAQGVLLFDLSAYYGLCAESMNAVISSNTVSTDASSSEAILAIQLHSAVVSGNELLGAGLAGVHIIGGPGVVSRNEIRDAVVGVMLDAATGVLVRGNTITDSGTWGIGVVDASSNNSIVGNVVTNSGQYDLYWDGTGSGNVWKGNDCQSSSPPGLCSGD